MVSIVNFEVESGFKFSTFELRGWCCFQCNMWSGPWFKTSNMINGWRLESARFNFLVLFSLVFSQQNWYFRPAKTETWRYLPKIGKLFCSSWPTFWRALSVLNLSFSGMVGGFLADLTIRESLQALRPFQSHLLATLPMKSLVCILWVNWP